VATAVGESASKVGVVSGSSPPQADKPTSRSKGINKSKIFFIEIILLYLGIGSRVKN
jgi:hypothetical protein